MGRPTLSVTPTVSPEEAMRTAELFRRAQAMADERPSQTSESPLKSDDGPSMLKAAAAGSFASGDYGTAAALYMAGSYLDD